MQLRGQCKRGHLLVRASDGRICRVPYDPALPVDTDWDLGIGDATAIWFSQSLRGGEIRLIDYYEHSGEGLPHYAGCSRSGATSTASTGGRTTLRCANWGRD